MTILLWIFVVSLLINEYDIITRKHKEYYWHMLTRYSEGGNTLLRLFGYVGIIIKATLLLPFLALITLTGI